MERVDKEGILATAQTDLHKLCACMPTTGSGTVVVEVWDIHQTGARFFTTDRVIYQPKSAMKTIVDMSIQQVDRLEPGTTRIIIVFPDEGSKKRFGSQLTQYNQAWFGKERKGDERSVRLIDKSGPMEDLKGVHAIIVDDLIRTGNTIMETARALREYKVATVTAAIIHADFDPGRLATFMRCSDLNFFVTTDSNPGKTNAIEFFAHIHKRRGDYVNYSCVGLFEEDLYPERGSYVLASENESKLVGLRQATISTAIWTAAAPSRVPAQPIGAEMGAMGALNRFTVVHNLYHGMDLTIVAFENYFKDHSDWVAVLNNRDQYSRDPKGVIPDITHHHCVVVPPDWQDRVPLPTGKEEKTFGERAQAAFNLPTSDAWIQLAHPYGHSRTQVITRCYERHRHDLEVARLKGV